MLKKLLILLCLITIVASAGARAADNLKLTKLSKVSSVPASFLEFAGEDFTSTTFKDDESKLRKDKVYYTATHSYSSSFPLGDIDRILNPADGKLGSLFEDTTVQKSAQEGVFDVMMVISTPIKNFDCASKLRFHKAKRGKKSIYTYEFTDFNMVFTGMVIQVEVESVGSETKIELSQIAAIKGSTFQKLKSFFAVGRFEKALKENIKKFKDGVGGI